MEKVIVTILGIGAIIAAYFIGTIKSKGIKKPLESDKKYIDRRKKKYEKELDKMSDIDIVNSLDNADDVRTTINKGKSKLTDLFHRRAVDKSENGNKQDN